MLLTLFGITPSPSMNGRCPRRCSGCGGSSGHGSPVSGAVAGIPIKPPRRSDEVELRHHQRRVEVFVETSLPSFSEKGRLFHFLSSGSALFQVVPEAPSAAEPDARFPRVRRRESETRQVAQGDVRLCQFRHVEVSGVRQGEGVLLPVVPLLCLFLFAHGHRSRPRQADLFYRRAFPVSGLLRSRRFPTRVPRRSGCPLARRRSSSGRSRCACR